MSSDTGPHGTGGPAVDVRGLVFRHGPDAFELRLPALELAAGEHVACVGPSGSGKSTLLALVAGILLPGEGEVLFEGTSWSALGDGERRRRRIRRIGQVFQEFELLDHLDVRENVLLPYFVNSALRLDSETEERVGELAASAGIGAQLNRHPRVLSMGERQRVAICRALVTRPALVLADEPTGNLDPRTSERVLDLLLEETRASGAALLFVTHDHGLLDAFDRVVDLGALAS